MQVSLEVGAGLERHLKVAVPAERVEEEMRQRLQSLARRANIAGFRPGKAPMRVVKQRYGDQVRGEVIGELVRSSLDEAIRQENLRPVGGPRVETKPTVPGQDLEYIATFEVYPQFDLAPVETHRIERPTAEVTEQDVAHVMERLRDQRANWTSAGRPAQQGDRVTVDYHGTVQDREAPVEAEHLRAVLGSGALLPELEAALVGASEGEQRTARVAFPENYPAKEFAGKRGEFTLTVTAVEAKHLPDLDEDFARSFGVRDGGLQALRREVQANMRRELERAIQSKVKQQVMDVLLQANPIELPRALLEREIARLRDQFHDSVRASGSTKLSDVPDSVFEESARRRVALGLVIAEIARKQNLKVDAERVRSVVEDIASTYEQPDEVARWIYSNRGQLAEIESAVVEDQVVDWVLRQAQIVDVATTFEALTSKAGSGGETSDNAA